MNKKFFSYIIITLCIFSSQGVCFENKFFEEGKTLFLNKKLAEAKIKFEKDIVFNPKNKNSYLYLAKIYNKKEKILLEKYNLDTVILLDPKNEEATYYLALLNIKNSNFSEAKKNIYKLSTVCSNFCSKEKELMDKLNNLSKN